MSKRAKNLSTGFGVGLTPIAEPKIGRSMRPDTHQAAKRAENLGTLHGLQSAFPTEARGKPSYPRKIPRYRPVF